MTWAACTASAKSNPSRTNRCFMPNGKGALSRSPAPWAVRVENLVVEMGLAGADEIKAGRALRPGKTLKRKLNAADVPNTLTRGSFARPAQAPARFKAGDRVRTKNIHPATHTRLPRYARDRVGTIETIRGCHVFPDTAALGKGADPQ